MSERLRNFLVDLAVDPDRMRRFAENPVAELDQTALDADERAAVLSHDSVRLRLALGVGDSDSMTQFNGAKKKYAKKAAKKKTAKKPAKTARKKPRRR
jgi:hypothetical protein